MAGVVEEGLDHSFFGVSIGLTPRGLENFEGVVKIVYTYIALLKTTGVQEWVFEEEKKLKELTFKFLEESQPADYTSTLAGWMHTYPNDHIIAGWFFFQTKNSEYVEIFTQYLGAHLIYEHKPDLIAEVVNALSPNNMNLALISKTFNEKTTEVEKWYNIQYNNTHIETAFLEVRQKSI